MDYIEKSENKNVLKIEIKNGQLEVTFEKKAEVPVQEEPPKPDAGEAEAQTENNERGEFFGTFPAPNPYGEFSLVNRNSSRVFFQVYKKLNRYYFYINENTEWAIALANSRDLIDNTSITYASGTGKARSVTQVTPSIYKLEGNETTGKLVPVEKGEIYFDMGESYEDFLKRKKKSKEEDPKPQDQKNKETNENYKSTLRHDAGKGYFNSENQLIYYETPKTLIIDGYELITNTPINIAVGAKARGGNGYITFNDTSYFDYKTGKLTLGYEDGSTEIVIRKLSKEELAELKQKQQKFQDKMGERTEKASEKKEGKKQNRGEKTNEVLPPGVFSAEQIQSIVFDLLEEEGKTPESYEIKNDENGVQTFVLKFTDGTTNEHSVIGILGLRLKIPIYDIEGIESTDGGKTFKLIWKEGIENTTEEKDTAERKAGEEKKKSEKEIELEKLIARKEEIAKEKERIAEVRAALLKKLEEIEKNKK